MKIQFECECVLKSKPQASALIKQPCFTYYVETSLGIVLIYDFDKPAFVWLEGLDQGQKIKVSGNLIRSRDRVVGLVGGLRS